MSEIFLSYAREDLENARRLWNDFRSAGLDVWFDQDKLEPGQDWKLEIEKAIRDSKIFIACLSSRSVTKRGFVQTELRRALDVLDQVPEGEVFIVPLRLDHCEVPHRLDHLHYVDVFEDGSIPRLISSIRTRLGGPAESLLDAQAVEPRLDALPRNPLNSASSNRHGESIRTEQDGSASIVLDLSEELQNKILTFCLLHVRDGKDQIPDKGPLLNREIVFEEIDRHGALIARVTYAKRLGFQFKCFADHKGTPFDEVKALLSSNGYEGIGKGRGKPFRAWFLLPEYTTCRTIDGITNNFYYPA